MFVLCWLMQIYIFERMVNANMCLNLIREFNTWHLS